MKETCISRSGFSYKVPKSVWGCAAIVSGMFLLTPITKAAPINLSGGGGGVYNISNINGQLVSVSAPCINWNAAAPCVASPGVTDQGSGDPLVFSVANGTIKDLMAGTVFPLVDFETAPGPQGLVHFDLISLLAAAPGPGNNCASSAVGTSCAPPSSPFFLYQASPNQVSITVNVLLEAYTGNSGTGYNAATPYVGLFTTQISGNLSNGLPDTIPNILAFENAGGSIQATWSAAESPVSAVPEPMSLLLFGSGLFGVALMARRFRRA
jgi:hypothetical protein